MKIEYLKIYTSRLKQQESFFREILELPVKWSSPHGFRVQAGYSVLEILEDVSATPYHIAFHIPPDQVENALSWVELRMTVLKDAGKKIVEFPSWKARSLYFRDSDGNVLEFISRENLFPVTEGAFSFEKILGLAEIGVGTTNVGQQFNFLNLHFGLEKFTGDYKQFCATGDDEGLFIIIDTGHKDWFPAGDKAYSSEFMTAFSVGSALFEVEYKNQTFQLQ